MKRLNQKISPLQINRSCAPGHNLIYHITGMYMHITWLI